MIARDIYNLETDKKAIISRTDGKIGISSHYLDWLESRVEAEQWHFLPEVPEIELPVLVYFSGAYCVMMRLKYTDTNGKIKIKWSDGNISYVEVDAWRELPAPPKKEVPVRQCYSA